MPLHKAKGKGKKAMAKAVAKNIKQLKKPGEKKRPMKQIVAIAYSAARKGKKKKSKKPKWHD